MGKRKGGNVDQKAKRIKSFTVLEPGWKGIFVTCARKKEVNCRNELVPIIEEYVEKMYPQEEAEEAEEKGDIEDLIANEVAALSEKKQRLVEGYLIGCECVIFIRVKKNIDPVKIVLEICKDAVADEDKRTRFVQRMTPVSELVHADLDNLPKFESYVKAGFETKGLKFAIRSTIRMSNVVKEDVITATARLVGPDQKVDLKQYDRLILLESFKSSIGLSVVDKRFDEYERFNLQQIYEKKLAKAATAADLASTVAEPVEAVSSESAAPETTDTESKSAKTNSDPTDPNSKQSEPKSE